MSSCRRGKGEAAFAWAARLHAVDAEGLAMGRLNELTASRVQADLPAKKEAGAGQGDDPELLRRCKECVRALSEEGRRRLLEDGMPA